MILRRLLIANRGEIAARILSTCRRLGIESILAASEADLDSVPARLADRVVLLGKPQPSASYLDVEAVVAAALSSGADAVHPGYGFLAENPRLARRCDEAGLVFVGATASQLEQLGDKLAARQLAASAGLPVVPGEQVDSEEDTRAVAARIGLPLVLKATAGGGGKGMTKIGSEDRIAEAFARAGSEARASFGDGRLYAEKFVERGRHVEVQVLGDGSNVIHLGSRDCSTQRRYQKLIEEAPAPGLEPALRAALHDAATRFAAACGYRGAGTVEFLVDSESNEFWFLEMNARIQVEHPVTEAVTGVDIVAEQLAIAAGQPLQPGAGDIAVDGHAIECRIIAEDPARNFTPSPGTLDRAIFPAGAGVRVDTHVEAGSTVPPLYDSLLAKIITRGKDRDDAIARMKLALRHCRIDGVATNLELQQALIADHRFAAGGVGIGFLNEFLGEQR